MPDSPCGATEPESGTMQRAALLGTAVAVIGAAVLLLAAGGIAVRLAHGGRFLLLLP